MIVAMKALLERAKTKSLLEEDYELIIRFCNDYIEGFNLKIIYMSPGLSLIDTCDDDYVGKVFKYDDCVGQVFKHEADEPNDMNYGAVLLGKSIERQSLSVVTSWLIERAKESNYVFPEGACLFNPDI